MPFQPGVSGNPKGAPKGRRHNLAKNFIRDLHEDWKSNGIQVLEDLRATNPAAYVSAIVKLIPREERVTGTVEHTHRHEHVELSETDRLITSLAQTATDGPSQEPVPH